MIGARALDDASCEEILAVLALESIVADNVADRLLLELKALAMVKTFNVSVLEHSLQTASRAFRDRASEETVVAALLHDIGNTLAPANHGELAAAILRPFVSEDVAWMVRHHPTFQRVHYATQLGISGALPVELADSPYFEITSRFCAEWDQKAFDPDYDTLPLAHFDPILRDVMRTRVATSESQGNPIIRQRGSVSHI
jgi:predicted HD phosphohydrolase